MSNLCISLVLNQLSCLIPLFVEFVIYTCNGHLLYRIDYRMFVQPLYCGVFLDQSLMLNRRRVEDDFKTSDEIQVNSNHKQVLVSQRRLVQ